MAHKSVAVLDIRSSEVSVFVGERGVNRTFVFKASRTENYDGYEKGAFYDVNQLAEAVLHAVEAVEKVCGERLKSIYVGVPGEFTRLIAKEQDIGFPKKRKITAKDIELLFNKGKEAVEGYRFIRASSMIYVTKDNQRVVDPVGISTSGLTGCVSYFYCSDYFYSTIEAIFKDLKISVKYLPTQFAMASYLVPSETRDECAIFLDAGFLSSTVCIAFGNGLLAQKTLWAGKGQVACAVMEKFSTPGGPKFSYEVALALLHRVNLLSKPEPNETEPVEFLYRGESYEYLPSLLSEAVEEGLDAICEGVQSFLESFHESELGSKPLFVSGEGLADIRGALEHIAKRLNRIPEEVVPDLPYYNKPAMSSRVALLNMACEDNRKGGFFNRLFGGFGG